MLVSDKVDGTKEIFAIWLCKPGTFSMPYLYEVCLCTWQIMNPNYKMVVYTNEPKFNFNLLSRDTTEVRIIDKWFPNLMERCSNIITDETPQGMRYAQRSDYIRYTILSNRGGIYVDCDLLCYSPIEELMENLKKENKHVIMAYEYTNRICNAFMACLHNDGKGYFCELLENYNLHYVKTSYTFNSIKYLYLLNRRYRDIVHVLPLKEGMFYPNWEDNENGDLTLLTKPECPLSGYGVHLYNTNPKWKVIRDQIDLEFADENHPWWICNHLLDCVNKYIDIMTVSETRDIMQDDVISNILKDLYGEKYLDQFKKEEKHGEVTDIHYMVN